MKTLLGKALIAFIVLGALGSVSSAEDGVSAEQKVLIIYPGLSDQENPIKAEVTTDAPLLEEDALAPAPPLTQIMIHSVGSSNCNWEYLSIGQWATKCDHGGSWLRVGVLEIGYGSNPVVRMNGNLLPGSARYSHQTVCIVNGYYTWPCRGGRVVGWFSEYNLNGYQGGRFEYENTSMNGRPNPIHVFVNIQ